MSENYSFNSMIGNVNTINLIKRQLENNTFNNMTLFSGLYGTGKSTSAKIVAMRLTCENPNGANPCCECPTCKHNIQAFSATGASSCVKIVNFGTFLGKEDVTDLIKDIFILRQTEKPIVYVFEEAHALKDLKGAQTAFLTEIDRMPKNTYVIMCTTNEKAIIPELLSRTIKFQFNRLSKVERQTLIKLVSNESLNPLVAELIAKYSDGIPRNIINSVQFVMNNQISIEEYKEYIQYISDETIGLLFNTMHDPDITKFIDICNELLNNREPGKILYSIKEFLLNALFQKEGTNTDVSSLGALAIDEALTIENINKCFSILDKYNQNLSEVDLQFMLYKMRLVIQSRTITNVITESSEVASTVAVSVNQEKAIMQRSMPQKGLKPLDITKLGSFS